MSQMNISVAPMIGSRVASTAPFDYNDAMTLLQKVEALRQYLNSLIEAENTNAAAYQEIVQQVNDYVQGALKNVVDLDTQYATALKSIQDTLAQTQQLFTDDQANLTTAMNSANSALETAEAMATAFNTETQNLTTGMNALTAAMNAKVDKGTLAFNVKDYGAMGDDVTDDTAAITNCINAAGIGGRVFFPDGSYHITSGLTQLSAQSWEGTSNEMGSVVASNPNPCRIRCSTPGIDAVTVGLGGIVERLHVAGPGGMVANSRGIVVPAHKSSYTLRDVSVSEFQTGIYVNQAWYGGLDRPFVTGCQVAINFDYCYNNVLFAPRITATPDGGAAGDGIQLNNGSMVSQFGGSIEAFQRGVVLGGGTSYTATGGYFETKTGVNATGVTFVGGANTATVVGWQVYMENLHFVHIPGNAGDKLISLGNHFKGGDAASWATCYYWEMPNSRALRMFVIHDDASQLTAGVHYVPQGFTLPTSSMLTVPYGVPAEGGDLYDGTIYVGGTLDLNGSVPMGIPVANSAPGMGYYDARDGAMVYRADLNKPTWYDSTGNVFRDATGAAVS